MGWTLRFPVTRPRYVRLRYTVVHTFTFHVRPLRCFLAWVYALHTCCISFTLGYVTCYRTFRCHLHLTTDFTICLTAPHITTLFTHAHACLLRSPRTFVRRSHVAFTRWTFCTAAFVTVHTRFPGRCYGYLVFRLPRFRSISPTVVTITLRYGGHDFFVTRSISISVGPPPPHGFDVLRVTRSRSRCSFTLRFGSLRLPLFLRLSPHWIYVHARYSFHTQFVYLHICTRSTFVLRYHIHVRLALLLVLVSPRIAGLQLLISHVSHVDLVTVRYVHAITLRSHHWLYFAVTFNITHHTSLLHFTPLRSLRSTPHPTVPVRYLTFALRLHTAHYGVRYTPLFVAVAVYAVRVRLRSVVVATAVRYSPDPTFAFRCPFLIDLPRLRSHVRFGRYRLLWITAFVC